MAAIGCIQTCIDDIHVLRATQHANRYKWPESDAEFIKSKNGRRANNTNTNHPVIVDSASCRQIYLRSYTFSKKETVQEKTKKCFRNVKMKIVKRGGAGGLIWLKIHTRVDVVIRNAKKDLFSFFRKLLSCTAKIDVVDAQRRVF